MLCCSIYYGGMFAFTVFDLVFQYWVKRLAGKNVSKVTYFVLGGTWNLNSIKLQMWVT